MLSSFRSLVPPETTILKVRIKPSISGETAHFYFSNGLHVEIPLRNAECSFVMSPHLAGLQGAEVLAFVDNTTKKELLLSYVPVDADVATNMFIEYRKEAGPIPYNCFSLAGAFSVLGLFISAGTATFPVFLFYGISSLALMGIKTEIDLKKLREFERKNNGR